MNQSTDNVGAAGESKSSSEQQGHGGKGDDHLPAFKKYAHKGVQNWLDPSIKLKPSDLEKPSLNVSADDYPMIIQLNNLQDNSNQVRSTVDIDEPLFQPAPKVVIFKDYAPFATHEKKLYFRNNDSVTRRIKVVQPATAFFEMSAPRLSSGEPLRSSAIAAGMEIYFIVRFKPQEVRDYSWDLVCNTEREKFIVPIRAIGMKPRITFPDEVHFGFCPVKSPMRKVLLVQNVGSAEAQFTMKSLNKCFSVSGEEMSMTPGSSLMIEIFFTPPTADPVEGEFEVEFNKGPTCYIAVSGAGKNVQVSLSTPSVALEPSYISLTSQTIVKIKNMSEIPINFKWKSFARGGEEEVERSRLLLEIDRMEEIERGALMQRIQEGFYSNSMLNEDGVLETSLEENDDLEDDGIPFGARAEDAGLVRKYRNLRRALEIDDMLFVDDIFEVTPSEGQVWASSEMEITVSFRPDTAAQYSCFTYLDVSGREDRLPLNMAGQGIGPHATLSFDVLDVGDVFVNDEQQYEISIVNKGDIAANWQFMSSLTRFGSKFKFSPTEGSLQPGQSERITILFESDVLGEFSENFRFNLQGNEDMLVCQIKGHVVGPTFHFDCSNIDFGVVSYDYLHESKLRLVNSSKIAMIFNLHVPQDGTYLKKEFNVEPCEGTLEPGQHMDILLEFIPSSVKVYDYSLVVDVLGVGDVLLSVPISAECVISPVELPSREIDFGECFIRYPYEKEFTMNNVSDIVHTKFEVLPQQDFTKATATFEAEPAIAVIEPSDSMSITIRLVCEKLGAFKIPILIQTAGSQEPPQAAVLVFTVVGPRIKVDHPELKWGPIECLKNSSRILKITNDSLIMASIKMFLKNARSKFELGVRELTLEPQEEYDLEIKANLDDSVLIKEEVHLVVEESENVMVPLSAKGVGTTMFSADDLSTLDLGTQLTNTHFERRIILENKGRRPQFLRWINKSLIEENAAREEEAKHLGKEAAGRLPKHLAPRDPIFTVALEEITLRPRTATTFVFKGKCESPGSVSETFILESRVGKERVMRPIIECKVVAEIINPLLEFSEPSVHFEYKWARGEDGNRLTQQRDVMLRNTTTVPLTFVLKTEVPFNLNSFEYVLQPQETADLVLDFDPLYKDDKQSHVVEKNLTIAYRGHHQRDHIHLTGDIIFPNLEFETTHINFGTILNESTKFVKVRVTNTSKVIASYSWVFLDEHIAPRIPGRNGSSSTIERLHASQLVDICPIRSALEPGQSELVEFSMFGQTDAKFHGQVLAVVEGGPEYKLTLQGDASAMAYSIEQVVVDFGKVTLTESKEMEFSIKNTGRVPLPFTVEAGTERGSQLLDIGVPTGKIGAGETIQVPVVVYPASPTNIVEILVVRVAHFDPVEVTCYCQAIFPSAVVSLPRYRKLGPYNETEGNFNQMWADFVSQATYNIQVPDDSLLPPSEGELPPPISASSSILPEYTRPVIMPPAPSDVAMEDGSLASVVSMKAPPQMALEMEMERMTMVKVLDEKIAETDMLLAKEAEEARLNPVEEEAVVDKKGRKTSVSTSKRSTAKPAEEEAVFQGLQNKIKNYIPMTTVVAGNFVCDFGNVILSQTRKKVFKVVNASLVGQMNWTFDTTRIGTAGFNIEPFKAQKLVEGDSIDFTVKFTARSSAKLGLKQAMVPLESKGSPTLNIFMQATICLPDVELSTDALDFEKILVGQSKRMYVRLHNNTPVTSVWNMKCSRSDRMFTVTPNSGSLRAGKKAIVCVEFIPTAIGKANCEFTMRIDNNKTPRVLSVSGEGLGVNVKWDSPSIELGPVVPYTEGDERIVTLTNSSDFDIEFYSLDFDTQYKEEEMDLGDLDIYDFEGFYRAPVRGAGMPLCDDITTAIAAIKKEREEAAAAEAAAAEAAAAAESAEEGGEAAPADGEEAQVEGESEGAAQEEPVEVWPDAPVRPIGEEVPRHAGKHQDIIVVGPPLSGVTTMSQHLARKLQLKAAKFDAILADISRTGGELGSAARRCLGTMSDREAAAVAEKEKELKEAAEASKVAVEEAFKADKKNKGKEIEPEMLQTDEVKAYEAFMASGSLTVDTVAAMLTHRLTWADAGWGFVLDSIVSDFADEETLLRGFEKAMPKAIVASIVSAGGREVYEQRIANLYLEQKAEIKHLKKAIQHGLKEREKLHIQRKKKGAKKGAAATAAAVLDPAMNLIKEALPYGDEQWVNQEPGLAFGSVIELDPQSVKALDEHQRIPYYNQMLWSMSEKLKCAKQIFKKIERIYDPKQGLVDPEAVRAETEAKAAAEAEAAGAADDNAPSEAEADAESTPPTAEGETAKEGEEGAPAVQAEEDPAKEGSRPISSATNGDSEEEEEELVLERVVYYQDYVNVLLPLLASAFKPVETHPEGAEGEAEGETEAPAPEVKPADDEAPAADGEAAPAEEGKDDSPMGVIDIGIEGDEGPEAVFNLLVALLPEPSVEPEDMDKVPADEVFQLVRKPFPRANRRAVRCFEILRVDPVDPEEEARKEAEAKAKEEAAAAAAAAAKGKKGAEPEPEPEPEAAPPTSYRWVIKGGETVQLKVRFKATVQTKYDSSLGFEVMGTQQQFSLHAGGFCEVPKINTDSRNVFMRRVKGVPPHAPPPQKRFIINSNQYSFGPLLVYKKAEWKALVERPADELTDEEKGQLASIMATNTDLVRITNTGRYKCTVDLGLEDKAEEHATGVYQVEPSVLELEEGETKDVRVWAFPQEVGEFSNALLACVTDNPEPMRYDLKAWGVEPTVDIDGPWAEAIAKAQQELDECEDKKALKGLEDALAALKESFTFSFDRQLINKSESKSFTITNTCKLPVAWDLDMGDFKESANVDIVPSSGTIPVNGHVTVTVSFTSPEPLVLEGGFSLRFSDTENGLETEDRVGVRKFKVVSEAYNIQTVALNAEGQEEGGSSIDYGILRVGDFATQSLKIKNKGKYAIGYKFVLKPNIASFLDIDTPEGVIEASTEGTDEAEIKLTFCSKVSEAVLKNNKSVTCQISEPLSGEVVETFPLHISADARFNRFRLQPSKGVTFGAVRFDADAKMKRVELRNESKFDFTYVICAKSAEVDELDALDAPSLACYAHSTPAAMRIPELGDNFKERLAGGGGGKAPAKGKGHHAEAGSQWNPLVHDPDELEPGTVPEDPLVVGAFTILPRIGHCAPGEVVGIDMKFDPNGIDMAREKVRICISGVDPNHQSSLAVRSFELSGESCFPAILTGDSNSIFEEQEVVEKLSEASPTGHIDKLPVGKVVYAESEKMLAFGPVMCGNASTKGVMERIRITNPTKIDTKINFKVLAPGGDAGAAPAGGKGGKGAPPPPADAKTTFSVQPEMWEIPPHEHRFVNVYFNPTEIKSYRDVFVAEVDYGGSSSDKGPTGQGIGKELKFDLAGSGTLPCIAIEEPTERGENGILPLDFSRVHIDKVAKRKMVIRNDGVMPATCLFQCTGDDDFHFPYAASSLTVGPGAKETIVTSFAPKKVHGEDGLRKFTIKVAVLNNQFDNYNVELTGTAYACDAVLDTGRDPDEADSVRPDKFDEEGNLIVDEEDTFGAAEMDRIKFSQINLAEGPSSTSREITVSSRSDYPLKFELSPAEGVPDNLTFSPKVGHLGPRGSRRVTITFSASTPVKLDNNLIDITLKRIEYKPNPEVPEEERDEAWQAKFAEEEALWGKWDDSMKSVRLATEADLEKIKAAEDEMNAYQELKAAEEAKGKKGKDPGPAPAACDLQLAEPNEEGEPMVTVVYAEPYNELVEDQRENQNLQLKVSAVADIAKYSCQYDGENIPFKPTFLFQATTHTFTFTNECNIKLPVNWTFDDIKHRTATARVGTAVTNRTAGTRGGGGTAMNPASPANIPCPFFVDPQDCEVAPNSSKTFTLRFQPLDADEFVYALKGTSLPSFETPAEGEEQPTEGEDGAPQRNYRGPVRIVTRGTAKRPVCHFDIKESPDYLAKRPPNMKNEFGLMAPIESTDLRVVSLESTGLRTRNTFRFHIINPTSDNFEFLWESIGEPSAYWRCVQSSGMLFGGKRIEVVFEYLPEETNVAENFFKFCLPKIGLEQTFLFSGHVTEPKVFFSSSRLDFHSVMLGGEGMVETIALENKEHLPFNFQFDKLSLLQLDGSKGPVIDIQPKQGTVAPHGRTPISFHFKPQDEVAYNYNIVCDVKRKPNKLSLNVKGEGYSVHPHLILELSEEQVHASASGNRFQVLKPRPAVNYADFGAVKVLDTVTKKITCANNGKYNFDFVWDIENIGSMLALSGGKLGGTLLKGEETEYKLTFAPQKEASLDGSLLSFTVAGKYTFDVFARGVAQEPALRFSFMQYDFGNCFVTSPGGQTVIEETSLRIVNHDPTSNISVECNFQKTRALWAECPPTVLEPGATLDVQIRFAPRDVKDYAFVVPFIVNGTSKVPVTVLGKGINARLELANASQRRLAFGSVDVGAEVRKVVPIVNKSKKALSLQIIEDSEYGQSSFDEKCVAVFPRNEVTIAPRESVNLQVSFSPNRRIPNFSEDVMIKYAGITRKLVTISGKGQGMEVSLDTDSLPFGNVVINSAKVKKLGLENSGDMAIAFNWMEASFGKHFSIAPLQGKVQPNSEMTFDVTFRPQELDDDVRQDGMILQIPGMPPINLTCTGACIDQPDDATQTLEFESVARKEQVQTIKFSNPTDKDWYLTPSLSAVDWNVPNEFKVPAKGSSDLAVTYYPLTMASKPADAPAEGEPDPGHTGKLFVALPDGTAQLYQLHGYAGPPECSGVLEMETSAKKPANIGVKLSNWLAESQSLKVSVDLTEKPSPATFVVAANAVEVGANSVKEFPLRFVSYTEGTTKGTVTFTNPATGEYAFYELVAKTTMPEVLEDIAIESCVRQSAKYVLLLENPLPSDAVIDMDCHSDDSWWSCDSECIRVKELTPLNGATEGSFEVEYRPLAVTSEPKEHLLSITSKDLGTYKYKLSVTATPPPMPQALRFEVPLGSVQSESFVFRAFNSSKADYTCAAKNADLFSVPAKVDVEGSTEWDGQDVRVAVAFEPMEIGTVRDTLTVTGANGVEYLCDITAECVPAMPQGPFDLTQGGGAVDIPFRNFFAGAEGWSFSTDNAAFKVGAASAQVPAKSEGKVSVSFAPESDLGASGAVISAKLFVACSGHPELPPFVFYLKGAMA